MMVLLTVLLLGVVLLAGWLSVQQLARRRLMNELEDDAEGWPAAHRPHAGGSKMDVTYLHELDAFVPTSWPPSGKVRELSSEELAGVTANLYSARGFTLVRQDVAWDGAELLLESPNRKQHVRVRCIPAQPEPLNAAELEHVVSVSETAPSPSVSRESVLVMPGLFSEDARGVAERRKLELVDGERLLRMLRRYLPGAAEALRLVQREHGR